ncbi:MAG: SET domain-containing protein-lysine N-methyltransferase [Acidobacteria bacterium]|nr:MAG: SET domain-containing protein-lysine N-methyltransferase [Acidobacteriota bacterium]REK05877.1 MAG: SET domain-containing protein-lysine N-methyltransferase [Acidobacteriota bacterium]
MHDALDVELPARTRLPADLYESLVERYSYVRADGSRILPWDFTRYMNHSCDATSFLLGANLEIAVRDVREGEQLTSDYASLNLERGFDCLCGSPSCRRRVEPSDYEALAPAWDRLIVDSLQTASDVAQPLADWFPRDGRLESWMREPLLAPSILDNRHQVGAETRFRTRRAKVLASARR